jgi:hypothetical protein
MSTDRLPIDIDLLDEIQDYLDNHSDAEYVDGIPRCNQAMSLLSELQREIARALKVGAAVVAFLAISTPARADVFDALAIAGAASDVVTTEVALNRGFVEQNIQNRPMRIGANVALTGGMLLAAREFDKAGHKGSARIVKVATFLLWSHFAVKNIQTMRGAR